MTDTEELLRRIRAAIPDNEYVLLPAEISRARAGKEALDQLTAILNERLLPELPEGWMLEIHKVPKMDYYCCIDNYKIGKTIETYGTTPRAAFLAALSRIEGEKQ